MKEESKKITLRLGKVSWDKSLGVYYIDMRPAMVHYTQNYYDGKFDDQHVPMIGINGRYEYFPVNICQYGFMLHADWLEYQDENKLKNLFACIERLEKLKHETEQWAVWYNNFDDKKYNIKAPWPSAMAQGEVISLYLRVYQITQNSSLLETAWKAYQFMNVDVKDGGVKRIDKDGHLWYEEFPSEPPSYVLNGFIYALFGLFDLYRVTGNIMVKYNIDACLETIRQNLPRFDAGYWSYYDLQKQELVRYYYQKNVHVPQLKILYLLTQEKIFEKYYKKWEKNITPINYLFVKLMYRVRPRVRKLKKCLWKN
ncbi:MAG: hypothetical protein HPY79_09115 [Bacteroidales bacterium]|nr:hypothetical protein [Bacteroidales bacterium]